MTSGPQPGHARAVPGRGHCYEPSQPLREQLRQMLHADDALPPAEALESSNWFERLRLRKEWQSSRLAALEQQVEELLMKNAAQAATIEALRARVSRKASLSAGMSAYTFNHLHPLRPHFVGQGSECARD